MCVVFREPFSQDNCIRELVEFKNKLKGAYAVKADKESEERWAVYDTFGIRKNKVKQNILLIYSNPEDEAD